ncbi:hypothetical protein CANTEDRAFT_103962 [Yamadazyma tenuis ATCC 10573]|uniref:Urea active transporter n=2 Tax=Candida tenuis TaxID=2315449 RepID=G3B1X6_CANTC|nr:uncharacterized protein CANTEDRAFT_103962 [Yamadazyma tenuis ATCC 10573]EGV64554.1 hypothetical protein CANTEDRAFT_103962 [Yamadazyma tenuis ATCC 10573]
MSDSSDSTVYLLNKASGYGILIGFGAFFAIMIVISTKLMYRYLHENSNSTEMFMVANRSIGLGLTASAIYSSWTWPTELLWVCTMVYNYGIMASFWYGAGLSVQICLMSVLGIEAKKKIPSCHTSLEIVNLRYGKAVHLLYMFLCLVTNLMSCSSMIVGASGAVSIIAGNLHIVASTMLIPFGVLLYTTVGGLKATFLTDFVHSLIVLIILCYINTSVLTSDAIGGLDGLYKLIVEYDGEKYIEGNYKGSILTGKSQGSIIFGIILTIGNFGLTVMDSSFWQKSFSANIRASVPGYLLAAGTIFSNVWPIGAIAGMAAIVLEKTETFPTYPRQMTQFEIDSGFVLPYVLKGVIGKGGLGALLLVIYLAVTSTVSAQLISVSSIVSFDIYKTYINKEATNRQILRVSHFGVVFFGLFAAGFSVMLHYVNVNMTWLGYVYTMIIGPGVIPLVLTITWSRQTKLAAFVSPITGLVFGFTVWGCVTKKMYKEVNVTTLGNQLPCLYGGLTALFLPAIVSVVLSLTIKPYTFNWELLRKAHIIIDEGEDTTIDTNGDVTVIPSKEKEVGAVEIKSDDPSSSESVDVDQHNDRVIAKYTKLAYASFVFVLLITWVIWPLPLYRDWIWSEAYFKGYVTVGLVWVYLALLVIGLFPIYDGRHVLKIVLNGVYRDFFQRGQKAN